jgi:hypothetical protein
VINELLRREVEWLQQQIERIAAGLQATAEGIELPESRFEVTVDTLDDGRQAVIKFDTDWVAATKILIARKLSRRRRGVNNADLK